MAESNQRGIAGKQATPSRAWLILVVLLLFSVSAPLNQFKVPPIMPLLMDALGLSMGRAGLLMSVFAVTGLLLALPSGFILQRVESRITGLLAGGSIVVGAALGALSPSIGVLLASRVIEGIGTSFMAVLAPAIIARWFARDDRGTAMGIWAAWVPVGTAAMLILAPSVGGAWGWRAVWWLGAGYALVATVVYLLGVGTGRSAGARVPEARSAPALGAAEVLRNRDIWLLAAAFGAFNAAVIGGSTYLPTFLTEERGLTLGQAALLSSVPTLITIVSAPGGGLVSDRIGSRKTPFLVGFVLALVLLPLPTALGLSGLVVLVIVQGIVFGLIPTNIFAAAVEAAGDDEQSGLAMAIIMVGQNGGMLLGPAVFGGFVEGVGWAAAFASLSGLAALGLATGWLARVR